MIDGALQVAGAVDVTEKVRGEDESGVEGVVTAPGLINRR